MILCRTIGLAALALIATVTAATAHPHVLIDAASEIVFDASGRISGVRHHWRFDEAFSAMAVQGLDADGDGKLTRAELEPLAKINVESLAEYEFFTWLDLGEAGQAFAAPAAYFLEEGDGQLTLHFTLPLKTPVAPDATVKLTVHDPEYFIAFQVPSAEAIRLTGAPAGCALAVKPAAEPDSSALAALGAVGADQRDLPDGLQALTDGTDNSATLTCTKG